MTCESSAMTATELPSAIPAVSNGSVAASSEPNTRSRTTSAAAAPRPVVLTLVRAAAFATCPSTSTWRPFPAPVRAASTKCFASPLVILAACFVSVTFAKAIRPELEICAAPAEP